MAVRLSVQEGSRLSVGCGVAMAACPGPANIEQLDTPPGVQPQPLPAYDAGPSHHSRVHFVALRRRMARRDMRILAVVPNRRSTKRCCRSAPDRITNSFERGRPSRSNARDAQGSLTLVGFGIERRSRRTLSPQPDVPGQPIPYPGRRLICRPHSEAASCTVARRLSSNALPYTAGPFTPTTPAARPPRPTRASP